MCKSSVTKWVVTSFFNFFRNGQELNWPFKRHVRKISLLYLKSLARSVLLSFFLYWQSNDLVYLTAILGSTVTIRTRPPSSSKEKESWRRNFPWRFSTKSIVCGKWCDFICSRCRPSKRSPRSSSLIWIESKKNTRSRTSNSHTRKWKW